MAFSTPNSTQISPERNKIWIEPKLKHDRKVPVVYYLTRNGQLEHPHFMEVPLSSPRGLFLKDVINRLNALRGKGMASFYSWSSKRSYKNGYVWHDLSEEDFIYPSQGHEYVLKGSELPTTDQNDATFVKSAEIVNQNSANINDNNNNSYVERRRRNQSCSSIDFNSLNEYNVYKAETTAIAVAADAATQTEDLRQRRRRFPEIVEESGKKIEESEKDEIEMIYPPPSDSSPESLETLMKADRRLIMSNVGEEQQSGYRKSGSKSSVLMQLISCGSISFKDCGAGGPGLGLISGYKMRLPRGGGNVGSGRVKLEDKEYFSGSIVETTKKLPEFAGLKRSTSCNADGSLNMDLETNGVSTAKPIPRKAKTLSKTKKEGISDHIFCDSNTSSCSLVRN